MLWGPRAGGVPLCAPLVVDTERLGLLCVLLPRPTSDSQSVLAAIASHAAVAVKRHQQIDSLAERNLVGDFFEALAGGRAGEGLLRMQATGLQCDLAAPHLVLHAVPWASSTSPARGQRAWWSAVGRLQSALRTQLAGSVFDRRGGSVRALLRMPPSGPEAVASQVRRLHTQVAGGNAGPVAVGLSNVSEGAASYPRRFSEAESAALVGSLLEGSAGVYTYEGLGVYRYALSAVDTVRDRHQEYVERLLDYGRTRDTDLLGTLDVYLELRGNTARTARRLDVHPNTLRQRLARIEQITELRVDCADWVALAMAIKTVKVRALLPPDTEL
jgi:sugar diacid utilization regulator